jgi:hypothetical protein
MTDYFIKTDAGRSESDHPSEKRDCSVRALALALAWRIDDSLPGHYNAAHRFLEEAGRRPNTGFHLETLLDRIASQDETLFDFYRVEKISFRATRGVVRMNVERFIALHPQGNYILRMAGHFACVRNGKLLDLFNKRGGKACVYTAFQLIEEIE